MPVTSVQLHTTALWSLYSVATFLSFLVDKLAPRSPHGHVLLTDPIWIQYARPARWAIKTEFWNFAYL